MTLNAKPKVIIVMPAYNVADVLPKTIAALPANCADEILLINDCSKDATAEVGKQLGLTVITHDKNRGYGGAQKTGYLEAVRRGGDIVVMVHGDNQYDPSMANQFVAKIRDEGYDVVTGTRMKLGDALKGGMPLWKFIPNRFLTWLENFTFRTKISDYHNGYRAYTADFLRQLPFDQLSERFDFDTDIMIQAAIRKLRIAEIPHPTRYKDENSQMKFSAGVRYGLSILRTVGGFWLHKIGIWRNPLYRVGAAPAAERAIGAGEHQHSSTT